MKITKLELTNFGRFHGKTILLHDGCNLIYGPNEAGKSTIHTFIYGMLFGLDPQNSDGKNSLYSRYLPWDTPTQYDGKLWFEKGGRSYRIERSFLRERRFLRLIDETQGAELTPAESRLSALLAPLNAALFRNTLLIRQMQTIPEDEFAPQLENVTANLSLTRSSAVNISAALRALSSKKQERTCTLHRDAPQNKMQAEERLRQAQAEIDLLETQLSEQEQRLAQIDAQLTAVQKTPAKQSDTPAASKTTKDPSKSFPRFPAVFCYLLCLLCALAAAGCLFTSRFPDALPAVTGVGWLSLLCAFIFDFVRARRNKKAAESATPGTPESRTEAELAASLSEAEPSVKLLALQNDRELQLREQSRLELLLRQAQQRRLGEEEAIGTFSDQLAQDARTGIHLQALDLASRRLEQLAEQIHSSYGLSLNTEASKLLFALTGGRYSDFSLDETLHITVKAEGRLLRAEQLSRGTLEQVYLSLRIAAAKTLSPGEPFPFLLDDVFAFYDDERLRTALRLLTGLNTQVILFSCHHREQEMLQQ